MNLFDILPIEIVALIVEYFDGITLSRFSIVCRKAKELSEHEELWSALIKRELAIFERVARPRALYYKKRKQEWEYGQLVKDRKKRVSEILAASPRPDSSMWSRLLRKVGLYSRGSSEYKIFCSGLDGAGKTTLLYKLQPDPPRHTIPTICSGFGPETITHGNWTFLAFNISGNEKLDPIWRYYCKDCVAMIWMVDSTDVCSIEESKQQLFHTFLHRDFPSPYLLIFANKQDSPNALPVQKAIDLMDLRSLPDEVSWRVEPAWILAGDGLLEGCNWLGDILGNHEEGVY